MLLGLLTLVRAAVELAEAEVAMGDEECAPTSSASVATARNGHGFVAVARREVRLPQPNCRGVNPRPL
jgi:hypothetical protein